MITPQVKKGYKRLAAAVITTAYADIERYERYKIRQKEGKGKSVHFGNLIQYWANDAVAFLQSPNADFYRNFFEEDGKCKFQPQRT